MTRFQLQSRWKELMISGRDVVDRYRAGERGAGINREANHETGHINLFLNTEGENLDREFGSNYVDSLGAVLDALGEVRNGTEGSALKSPLAAGLKGGGTELAKRTGQLFANIGDKVLGAAGVNPDPNKNKDHNKFVGMLFVIALVVLAIIAYNKSKRR